jgi:DNA-binding response OmpR family regulator
LTILYRYPPQACYRTDMRNMDRILVIDDDAELCGLVGEYLEPEGFQIEAVHDGTRGLERALDGDHLLIVLDVMLPGLNGFDVLRRLRVASKTPVLLLTARGEDVDRIVGLEIGADDYLPKPFNPRELIARIRAILRRSVRLAAGTHPLIVGDLRLDPASREARLQGQLISITSVEFALLEMLMQHAGRIVTREELTEVVLGRKLGPFDRVIDVHVSNIRKKLGTSQGVERIKAIRGSGYLFVLRAEPK